MTHKAEGPGARAINVAGKVKVNEEAMEEALIHLRHHTHTETEAG
jgi:hypothetical protein